MIQYLKHGRKPVWVGLYQQSGDPQAAVPAAWCPVCGAEIFRAGEAACENCREFMQQKEET